MRRVHHGFGATYTLMLVALLLAVVLPAGSAASSRALLQDGSCSSSRPCPNEANCCSQWGYCGTSATYCGTGCQNGPCYSKPSPPTTPSPPGPSGSDWTSFFTKAVFEAWFPNRIKSFYTYEEFSKAARAYPAFGTAGKMADNKREIAAFFGNVQQESGGLVYIEEIDASADPNKKYCDANKQYPCAPGKKYFGRGPLQLTWNYNYGECGKALGLNLLANPDQVAHSGATAFKTALWFWMTQGCHQEMVKSPPSFGGTIRIINGMECGNSNDDRVVNRVTSYKRFCKSLGVDPGTNLHC